MIDLEIKVDSELKTFLKILEQQIKLDCATFGHQWRKVPASTGLVTMCVRCGERQESRFVPCPRCFGSGEIEVDE